MQFPQNLMATESPDIFAFLAIFSNTLEPHYQRPFTGHQPSIPNMTFV